MHFKKTSLSLIIDLKIKTKIKMSKNTSLINKQKQANKQEILDLEWIADNTRKKIENTFKEVFKKKEKEEYLNLKNIEEKKDEEKLRFAELDFLLISWNKKYALEMKNVFEKSIINEIELEEEDFQTINNFYSFVEWKDPIKQDTMLYAHMFWESIVCGEDSLKALVYAKKAWNDILSELELAA